MTPEELLEQWTNGNRKDVVRKLARADRTTIFGFLLLVTNPSELTTLMVLALDHIPEDGWQ